jgi:hypothetical protein
VRGCERGASARACAVLQTTALLTADGSDDHLIKLEGAPAGYKLII